MVQIRLLASSRKKSGAWLNPLPVAVLGLRMDDETTHIVVGLRLGTPLCSSHECSHCGTTVDDLTTHSLSCHWSEGRHPRHAAVNNIIHRAWLEPLGLFRSDGKHPNGRSLCRGSRGRCLCGMPHGRTPTHLHIFSAAAREAGAVAAKA